MMDHKMRGKVQIFFVLLFASIALACLSIIVEIGAQPSPAAAQAPEEDDNPFPLSAEKLAEFGLSASELEADRIGSFDLQVVKTTDVSTVASGSSITFEVLITNNGPDPATGVFFYDDAPSEMKNIAYVFSVGGVNCDTAAKPTCLFTNPIPNDTTVAITVTGVLTSARNVTVTNTAVVTTFPPHQETAPTNNTFSVKVGIAGSNPSAGPLYLPLLRKAPTPTPTPTFTPSPTPSIILAYSEDFSSSDAWIEFDSAGCLTDNRESQYWVDLDPTDRECLPPARNESKPERPYRSYGEFEVAAYHSDGQSDAAYGIWINGQGADNYYLFRIWPNSDDCSSGGDWQLLRRRSGTSSTVLQRDCDSAVIRGVGSASTNVVRIRHTSDRTVSVYINSRVVGIFRDSDSQHLTGEATGIYVRSRDEEIRIKFDDFRVYRVP